MRAHSIALFLSINFIALLLMLQQKAVEAQQQDQSIIGTASTSCQVSYNILNPCDSNGQCPVPVGVYCCCGASSDAVYLPDQNSLCHVYYNTSECNARRLDCTGCANGYCTCQSRRDVSWTFCFNNFTALLMTYILTFILWTLKKEKIQKT